MVVKSPRGLSAGRRRGLGWADLAEGRLCLGHLPQWRSIDFLPLRKRIPRETRKSPARLGAAFDGSRLSKLYAEDLDHIGIIAKLKPLFAAYAAERKPGERFGAFVIRAGLVAPTTNGATFIRTPERSGRFDVGATPARRCSAWLLRSRSPHRPKTNSIV
jgi:hypothetical protein